MAVAGKYIRQEHPTIDELAAEQGVVYPRAPRELLGDIRPEDESADDFLKALREWRGHRNTDPAALYDAPLVTHNVSDYLGVPGPKLISER
jgi:hypothetical protein